MEWPSVVRLVEKINGSSGVPIPRSVSGTEFDVEIFVQEARNPSFDLLAAWSTDVGLSELRDIDVSLFRYLAPWSLGAWQVALRGGPEAQGAAHEFCAGLSRNPGIFHALLGEVAEGIVEQFVIDSLLASLHSDVEGFPSLNWVPYWLGVASGMPRLNATWIALLLRSSDPVCIGALISYVSRIAYRPLHNPVFPSDYDGPEPWTRYRHVLAPNAWTPEQASDLMNLVSGRQVLVALNHRKTRMLDSGDPNFEIKVLLAEDFMNQVELYDERLAEVGRHLTDRDPPEYWTDTYSARER